MTVAALTQSNIINSHPSRLRIKSSQNARIRKTIVWILIFVIICIGILYIFTTNNIAAEEYKIRSLQKQVRELEAVNKTLKVEVSALKSVNILEAKGNDLDMVKAQKIEYVSSIKNSAMLVR